MKRLLLIMTVAILGGLVTRSFTTSFEVTAGRAEGLVHPVVQAGKSPSSGPISPQSAPRTLLLPKFAAETALPPELAQTQKNTATPSPLERFPNTFEGRMGKLNFFSQTNAFQPAPAPPEMQMLARAKMPPNQAPPLPLTLQQLRSYLLAEPGGREMLEEAKRRGLRVSQSAPDQKSSVSLADLFRSQEAQAADAFKVVFTAREPKNSLLTFVGVWLFDPFRPLLDSGIHYGAPQGKSYTTFNVNVPREGMYFVTVRAFMTNVLATLTKGGTVVRQFDYGPNTQTYDHWGYAHLAAGSHSFYFYVDRGTAEFIEVNVHEDASGS
jgi:hypothetical protein